MPQYQGRPAYLRIADDLRAQILTGDLRGGDRLPSESALMADYGVSRIVVRNAVEVLTGEGLATKRQGKGSFVRDQRPRTRRIVGHLYGTTRPTTSPFAEVVRAVGLTPEWEYGSRRTTATAAIAERLGLRRGDPVMCTHYRFTADGEPIMLSTSYEPLELTAGTAIESPEAGPVTGVVPRMDAIGQRIVQVTEEVHARAPRPFEAETLGVPPGVPVLVIARTYITAERPVETADIVVSADRYALTYHVPIPGAEVEP